VRTEENANEICQWANFYEVRRWLIAEVDESDGMVGHKKRKNRGARVG
jgi:hypothetical protein